MINPLRVQILQFLYFPYSSLPSFYLFKELAIMKNLICAGHSLYTKSIVVKKKKSRDALFNKASL